MIPEPVLNLAVQRGLVTADQAAALHALAQAEAARNRDPGQDPEKLRFVSGFADIFVVIGIALFIGAASYFLSAFRGQNLFYPALAALSWLLSELFARYRRMALPSIVLLLLFTAFCFLGIGFWMSGMGDVTFHFSLYDTLFRRPNVMGLAALITLALVYGHYLRFRVPITVAAGAAALGLAFYAFLFELWPRLIVQAGPWVVLIIGLAIFALAMRYDRTDLARETRRTDIAFWLHLLAAPVVVHSFVLAVFGDVAQVSTAQATGLLALFGVLAILALLIDRRAILVSALLYAGVAFGTLLRDTNLAGSSLPATFLVLGVFILALSAGWHPLRSLVLAPLPKSWRDNFPSPQSP